MARRPNYDFERRERAKAKAAKKEERAKAKADRKPLPTDGSDDKPAPDRETP